MTTELMFRAARAYHEIVDARAEQDLIDHLAASRCRWKQEHPNHDWDYRDGSISGRSLLCDGFAALIGDPDAFSVMQAELGDHWPTIAANEIIAFASRLSARRRSA